MVKLFKIINSPLQIKHVIISKIINYKYLLIIQTNLKK